MDIPPLPPFVKVGYRRYKIVEWNPSQAVSADRYGECDHTMHEIRLTLMHGWTKAANTLLHEILHAVWAMQALHDKDEEERYVTSFANGLCSVWSDNPDVIRWIDGGITSEAA